MPVNFMNEKRRSCLRIKRFINWQICYQDSEVELIPLLITRDICNSIFNRFSILIEDGSKYSDSIIIPQKVSISIREHPDIHLLDFLHATENKDNNIVLLRIRDLLYNGTMESTNEVKIFQVENLEQNSPSFMNSRLFYLSIAMIIVIISISIKHFY